MAVARPEPAQAATMAGRRSVPVLEQHVNRAGAAVIGRRRAVRHDFVSAAQPAADASLEHRPALSRAQPLAMDDAHAAIIAPPRAIQEFGPLATRGLHKYTMQIQFCLTAVMAAAQFAQHA